MATQTNKPNQIKPTMANHDQPVATAREDPHPPRVHDAAEQAHAIGMATQPAQELMVQLVRHGLNFSLKSLQVWADLARQLDPTPLGSTVGATMVSLAYDGFERLLAAQREIVDQLVTIQRQLAPQFFSLTPPPLATYPPAGRTTPSGRNHKSADTEPGAA